VTVTDDRRRGRDDVGGEHPDGADGVVGQLPAGHLDDGLVRLAGVGERVGRAELPRLLPLERHRVDDHEVARAGIGGALDGVHPDPARAEDDDGVTGGHPRHVDRGAPAGRDAAPDQRGDLEGDVRVDADAGGLLHHGALAERAQHAEPAEVVAVVVVEAEAAVGELPGGHLRAAVAQVLAPGRAVAAHPAGGDERADDVVADGHPAHRRAHRLDDAGTLVPADHRQPGDAVTGAQVLVGVAHAGDGEPDPHLLRLRRVQLQLGDLPGLARLPDDGGPRPHAGCAPCCSR
jgi:hypothetical protein